MRVVVWWAALALAMALAIAAFSPTVVATAQEDDEAVDDAADVEADEADADEAVLLEAEALDAEEDTDVEAGEDEAEVDVDADADVDAEAEAEAGAEVSAEAVAAAESEAAAAEHAAAKAETDAAQAVDAAVNAHVEADTAFQAAVSASVLASAEAKLAAQAKAGVSAKEWPHYGDGKDVEVTFTYCSPCGFYQHVKKLEMIMTSRFPELKVTLVPNERMNYAFEVKLDDDIIYNKVFGDGWVNPEQVERLLYLIRLKMEAHWPGEKKAAADYPGQHRTSTPQNPYRKGDDPDA